MSCCELYDSSHICCSELRQATLKCIHFAGLISKVLTASEKIQLCRLAKLQSIFNTLEARNIQENKKAHNTHSLVFCSDYSY